MDHEGELVCVLKVEWVVKKSTVSLTGVMSLDRRKRIAKVEDRMFKVAGELLEGVEAGIEKSSNSIKFVNFKWIQDWNPIRKSGRSVKYFTYVEVKQMESNLKFLIHKWVYTWGGAQEGEQVDESKATIGGLYRSWPHQPTWRESLLRCIYKKKGGGGFVCVCVWFIFESC